MRCSSSSSTTTRRPYAPEMDPYADPFDDPLVVTPDGGGADDTRWFGPIPIPATRAGWEELCLAALAVLFFLLLSRALDILLPAGGASAMACRDMGVISIGWGG